MSRIFISHSSANNGEAIAIRDWLMAQGWDELFLDLDPERGLKAGERWQAALKRAAERCELVIFLISPAWAQSKWCLAEFLLAKSLNKRIFGVVVAPTPFADLPPEMTTEWQIVDLTAGARDFHITPLVAFATEGITRLRIGLLNAGLDARYFAWPPDNDPERPPYRGLRPLEAEDAGIFFGREAPVIEALDRLRGLRDAPPARLLVMLGASGAGKSSFLRAGVLPRLARDDRQFLPLPIIRPERAAISGETGLLRALEGAMRAAKHPISRPELRSAIDGGAATLRPLLIRLLPPQLPPIGGASIAKPPTLVLSIDQGDELFHAEGQVEASALLTIVRDLLSAEEPAVIVIFTIRSDNFERLQVAKELEGIRQTTFSLPSMPVGSYGEIIEGPARRLAGTPRALHIEPALTAAMLADLEAGGAKDALPLLAFTLERLYAEFNGGGHLLLAHYNTLGRVQGSIRAAVDRAFDNADADPAIPKDHPTRIALLRRGFIPWLAGIDLETEVPRRRVAKLSNIPAEARPLIAHIVDQRLLSTDVAKDTGETTIEPAHDALLRQWRQLNRWLADDAELLRTMNGVRSAARDWDKKQQRAASWLAHTGVRLQTAESGLHHRPDLAADLDLPSRDYLAACRARDDAELAQVKALNRRRRRRRLAVLATITSVAVFAISQWAVAIEERDRARVLRAMAGIDQARLAGAAGNDVKKLLLLHEIRTELRDTGIAEAVRKWRVATARLIVFAVPYPSLMTPFLHATSRTADLRRDAIKESENLLYSTMNSMRELKILPGHEKTVYNAAFNPQGTLFATGDESGILQIWNSRTLQKLPTDRRRHTDRIRTIVFCPTEPILLTASNDKTIKVWNSETGSLIQLLEGHEKSVATARFDKTCAKVVSAGEDNTIRIWDWRTKPDNPQILIGHGDHVNDAAYTPDGRFVISASDDKQRTIGIWDPQTGQNQRWLKINKSDEGANYSFAFNPQGTLLATASADGVPQVWDVSKADPADWTLHLSGLEGPEDEIYQVEFSPDGHRLLAASADGAAWLWRIGEVGGSLLGTPLRGHKDRVHTAHFSTDGRRIITASTDKTARVWDAASGAQISVLQGHLGKVYAAEFSPDGDRIVTGSTDSTVRVWDGANGQELSRFPLDQSESHTGPIVSSELSPEGKHAVTASLDKSAKIWDLNTGVPKSLKHVQAVWTAEFSPSGDRVVTASDDKTAAIWTVPDGQKIMDLSDAEDLPQHDEYVSGARFSPDGRYVLTFSGDKTARIWDTRKERKTWKLEGHSGRVVWGEFDFNGVIALTVSGDSVTTWDTEVGKSVRSFKAPTVTNLTVARFSPDATLIAGAGENGLIYIWSVESGDLLTTLAKHDEKINYLIFAPNGETIASASHDTSVKIWNVGTGTLIHQLKGHSEYVTHIAFKSDGSLILTTSADGSALVWDVKTGIEIVKLTGHTDAVVKGGFVPNRDVIYTSSRDKTLRFWRFSPDRKIYVPGYGRAGASATQDDSGGRVRVNSTDELLDTTVTVAPRCLSPEERQSARLLPVPPLWCIEQRKWPYDRREWQQWLRDTNAGRTSKPPIDGILVSDPE